MHRAPSAALAMRVLVTGAAGFLGRALVHALRVGHDVVATDSRATATSPTRRIVDRLFAAAVRPRLPSRRDRQRRRRGRLRRRPARQPRRDARACSIAAARRRAAAGRSVRFVHASSIAVFGTPLPERIDDAHRSRSRASATAPTSASPSCSIDDATRRGELDGRALRLSGVVVRPALPNGALSAFNSDVIREPLAGRDYECPVGADATIWVTSRRAAVANLLHLADARRRRDRRAARAHGAGARPLDRRDRRRARPLRCCSAGARSLRAAARRSKRSSAAGRSTARSRAPSRSAWSAKRRSTR